MVVFDLRRERLPACTMLSSTTKFHDYDHVDDHDHDYADETEVNTSEVAFAFSALRSWVNYPSVSDLLPPLGKRTAILETPAEGVPPQRIQMPEGGEPQPLFPARAEVSDEDRARLGANLIEALE